MANHVWTSSYYSANDAYFRAWGKGISDAMAEVGMVKVDQGGCASNWNSVIAGYSASQVERGWEVWRFPTSAMQTAAPVFIRFGYWSRAVPGVTNLPGLNVQIGHAPGTGGVIDHVGATHDVALIGNGSASSTSVSSWASCDGHGLALVFHIDTAVTTSETRRFLIVDRFRDAEGEPLPTGLIFAYGGNGNTNIGDIVFDLVHDEYRSISVKAPCITPGGFTSVDPYLNANDEIQLWPWEFACRAGSGYSKMIATHAQADIVAMAEQEVRWLPAADPATDRVVRACGQQMPGTCFDIVGSVGACMAIWWDDPTP